MGEKGNRATVGQLCLYSLNFVVHAYSATICRPESRDTETAQYLIRRRKEGNAINAFEMFACEGALQSHSAARRVSPRTPESGHIYSCRTRTPPKHPIEFRKAGKIVPWKSGTTGRDVSWNRMQRPDSTERSERLALSRMMQSRERRMTASSAH